MYDMENDPDNLLSLSVEKAEAYHKDFKELLIAKGVIKERAEIITFLRHITLQGKIRAKLNRDRAERFRESMKVKREPIIHDGMYIVLSSDEEVLKMIEDGEEIIQHGIFRDKCLVKQLANIGLLDEEIGNAVWLSVEEVKDYKKETESDCFF